MIRKLRAICEVNGGFVVKVDNEVDRIWDGNDSLTLLRDRLGNYICDIENCEQLLSRKFDTNFPELKGFKKFKILEEVENILGFYFSHGLLLKHGLRFEIGSCLLAADDCDKACD